MYVSCSDFSVKHQDHLLGYVIGISNLIIHLIFPSKSIPSSSQFMAGLSFQLLRPSILKLILVYSLSPHISDLFRNLLGPTFRIHPESIITYDRHPPPNCNDLLLGSL